VLASQTQSSLSSSSSCSSPQLNYNKIVQTHNTKTLRNPAPREDEIRNPKKLEIRQVQEELLHHLEICEAAAGVEVVVVVEEEVLAVIVVVRTQRINNPRLLFQWGWMDGSREGGKYRTKRKRNQNRRNKNSNSRRRGRKFWRYVSFRALQIWRRCGRGGKKLSKGSAYLGMSKLDFFVVVVVVVLLLLPLIAI
jgi:hypothetical protein